MRRLRRLPLLLLAISVPRAQTIIDPARLGTLIKRFTPQSSDRPLDGAVTPIKPSLNFSFHMQAGYVVRVPMHQFEGKGHAWLVTFRITPEGGDRKPVYFGDKVALPEVPQTNVELEMGGGFLLGTGQYRMEWLMTDDRGRIFRKDWRIDAKLKGSERLAKVATPPFAIQAFSLRGEGGGAGTRDDRAPFRVTILMNATPLLPWRTRLRASDQVLLIGSLSALVERLPARSVRLVVFNLDQQREIFRRDGFTGDAIGDVADAIAGLNLNLVDYQVLQKPGGFMELLSGLVTGELQSAEPSDAVIFLGPTTHYLDKPPVNIGDQTGGGSTPLFCYFQYKPGFSRPNTPLPPTVFQRPDLLVPDVINQTVTSLKGRVFTIFSPGDFAKAIDQLERRVSSSSPPADHAMR
ncbi:MAG TPA: hypothetical protein VML19_17625 [Verrucomicrobiae bacterium]|nr:hypothetical protein [Verrucomicrobiae bacterium]